MKQELILGKKLFFVTAHPDDESFTAAGTILKNHQAGGKTWVMCATYGERGMAHLEKPLALSRLKTLRKKELGLACKTLKVDRVYGLGLPDRELVKYRKELYEKILSLAARFRPDFVISFGKDGISGHMDHIAAGDVALKAAKKLGLPFAAFSLPPRLRKDFPLWQKQRIKHGLYLHRTEFGLHDIKVQIAAAGKLAALRKHKTQLKNGVPFAGFPPIVAREWLKAEYFTVFSRSINK